MASEPLYTAGLSAKAALLEETRAVLRELDAGLTIAQVRARVLEQDLLGKDTVKTRESTWDRIHARYLSDPERARLLARMVVRAPDRQSGTLALFVEFCLANPLLRDVTRECVYPRYRRGFTQIDGSHIQQYLDRVSDVHPEVEQWSPQTRNKVVSNALTVLRDFGLLEGVQTKRFARLYVPVPAFAYAVYRLRALGLSTPSELMASEDWRLLLLTPEDVVHLLEEGAAHGHWTFKHQGDIYVLDYAYPSLEVCVAALT